MVRSAALRAWPRRWGLVAALLLSVAAGPAGANSAPAPVGPGRIAVVGTHPTGIVGVLARHGLPRDILLDYQLRDPDVLAGYDLLIVAGISPGILTALPAMEQLLQRGGSLLVDCSVTQAVALRLTADRRAPGLARLLACTTRPVSAFRPARDANPPLPGIERGTTFPAPKESLVPRLVAPEQTTILAEYFTPQARRARQAARFPNVPPPDGVAPAILLVRHGPGKLILCGPAIALSTALQGLDYDRLVLAMLHLLSDGRAVPQLEPEGPRLRRKQSGRSLQAQGKAPAEDAAPDDEAEANTPPPVPERPPGPGKRGPIPRGFTLVEEEPATEFNLSGQLGGKQVELLLNHWNAANTLQVTLGAEGVRVVHTTAGKARGLARVKTPVRPGTPFVVKVRHARLLVIAGTVVAAARLEGVSRGAIAVRGAVTAPRYQPVEPALFSDDFMRTSDEDGGWETHGGTWKTAPVQNPNLGANPFSYRVEAGAAPAVALMGYPYWDEYRCSVAARPESEGGAVGLGLYARDEANMLFFRARVRPAAAPLAEGFSLVRLVNGKLQTVCHSAGGLLPGQWYRLEVKAEGPWIGAFVDGEKVLAARDTTFTGGRIALRVEQGAARFDDVLVEPAAAPRPSGHRFVGRVPAFAGVADVDSWAGPATAWEASPDTAGLFWRRGLFLGDVGLRFAVPPLPDGGEAMLLLDGDCRSLAAGYALHLRRSGGGLALELRHQGRAIGRASVPASEGVSLSLRRAGTRVLGLVEDRVVLKAPYAGGGGGRVALRAVGFRPRLSRVALWAANVRDYTFDTAPVDWWVGSGEWDVTNRWSCTPDWSWFGGYSPEVAAIWHKWPLRGDVVLDLYAAPKMIGDGPRRREQFADFNAVLCGDGSNIDSGYAFLVGEQGRGARILRRGQVVAENPRFRFFGQGHNRWANIRVEKQGAILRLTVEGQVVLQWADPVPLAAGYAGIWTRNNGIILPRITLYYAAAGAELLSVRR